MKWFPLAVLISLSAAAQQTRTINLTAKANPWEFTPASFTVNAGDLVTLNISVASTDASPSGHGFLMETYVPDGVSISKGQTRTVSFTASTPGTFAFVCTVASCGIGHSSMFGQMIVNGAATVSITDVIPATGPTSGGTSVSIFGQGFEPGATVTFGGLSATSVTVVSSSSIIAVTPVGPASEQAGLAVDVTVRNADGTTATKTRAWTYTVPPLAITTLTPSAATAGAVVTITGAGFTSAVTSAVTFGGVDATNVIVVDAVTIKVTAPAHASGIVDVTVRMGSNSVTKKGGFTYVDPRRRAVRH
jgi:plastocyanin